MSSIQVDTEMDHVGDEPEEQKPQPIVGRGKGKMVMPRGKGAKGMGKRRPDSDDDSDSESEEEEDEERAMLKEMIDKEAEEDDDEEDDDDDDYVAGSDDEVEEEYEENADADDNEAQGKDGEEMEGEDGAEQSAVEKKMTRSSGKLPVVPVVASKMMGKGKGGKGKKALANRKKTFKGVRNTRLKLIAKRANATGFVRTKVHELVHACMENFLETIMQESSILMQNDRRKTLMPSDVIYALERNGLYVYNDHSKEHYAKLHTA